MNVLFIGATGLVGSHTAPLLAEKFALTCTGLKEGQLAGLPVQPLDICDWDATASFIQNGTNGGEAFDAVIYCATANYHHIRMGDAEERRRYYEQCIEVNMRGAYHVFEAAWRAGITRVVHIGSMTSIMGYPRYESIDTETRDRPNDLYAATKIFGEHVGRSYAFRKPPSGQQMKVICLRLAQPTAADDLRTQQWIAHSHYTAMAVDMRDIALAMECALTTEVQYGVYPLVSGADEPYVDPQAYAELGYVPQWKYVFTEDKRVEIHRHDPQATAAVVPSKLPLP